MLIARPRLAVLVVSFWALISASLAHAQIPGPLAGSLFGSGQRALVVVLHGDLSNGGNATYHRSFAEEIARRNQGVVAVALIRPGYSGGGGLQSAGSNNNRRDHYTRQNNDLVAQSIQALQRATGARRVIVVGHSGGAAQTGAIIGRYPQLVDSAVLVSCPCDIARWRTLRGRSAWQSSESPSQYASRVARSTRVIAVVGSNDSNTVPVLSQDYVAGLQARGVPAALMLVRGGSHDFNTMRSAARSAVEAEIQR
jgi:Dipeptidyl aminopeptidases/acylaminoacyl-peptidases